MSWQSNLKKDYEEYNNKVETYLRFIKGYRHQIEEAYPEKKLNEIIDSLIGILQTMRND